MVRFIETRQVPVGEVHFEQASYPRDKPRTATGVGNKRWYRLEDFLDLSPARAQLWLPGVYDKTRPT